MGPADATLPALQDNGLWGYLSEKNLYPSMLASNERICVSNVVPLESSIASQENEQPAQTAKDSACSMAAGAATNLAPWLCSKNSDEEGHKNRVT